jgi:hypothetical protein
LWIWKLPELPPGHETPSLLVRPPVPPVRPQYSPPNWMTRVLAP